MPCRDYEDFDSATIADLRKQNDKLARVACELSLALNKTGFNTKALSNETQDWVNAHTEADRKEQERKAKVKAALKKLTPEEIALLSLQRVK